ncbi:MAG: hypothetical protein J5758_01950 [Abditibacteriota bacterium]|nr:hypothetical protein [Abditibacteriota bacterium]
MRKNIAAERREVMASTGPEGMGFKRFDRVKSPGGESYIFIGIRDGEAYVERCDGKDPLFRKVDAFDFQYWKVERP